MGFWQLAKSFGDSHMKTTHLKATHKDVALGRLEESYHRQTS
jgi:hypothetical protein